MDFHQWAESMVYEQAHSYADMTRKDIENFGLHTCIWSKKRFPAPEMKTLRYPKWTPTALPTSLNESSSGAGDGWLEPHAREQCRQRLYQQKLPLLKMTNHSLT